MRREVLALAPDAAEQRERRACEERRVVVSPDVDGTCTLWALLPAVDGVRIREVLTAAAKAELRADPDDDRTVDQARADVLAGMFRHAAAHGVARSDQPVGAGVDVHVPVDSLLGLSDQPGALDGYVPLTAQAVRALAPSSRLRRVLVEKVTGKVLDVGRTGYAPTAAIARHVRAAFPRCTFPGCEQ